VYEMRSELLPYMLQVGLTWKPSELQRVDTGGEGKDVKVWR